MVIQVTPILYQKYNFGILFLTLQNSLSCFGLGQYWCLDPAWRNFTLFLMFISSHSTVLELPTHTNLVKTNEIFPQSIISDLSISYLWLDSR